MAKRLADARTDMIQPKVEKVAEPVLNPYLGKVVAITTRELGCDLTLRLSNSPKEFELSQILKISK